MDLLELIRYSKNDKPLPLHQWDLGRKLKVNQINNIIVHEVDFSNKYITKAITVEVRNEDGVDVVDIPNNLLQMSCPILAHPVYNPDDREDRITVHDYEFEVKQRPQPPGYVYTPTEIKLYDALEKRIEELENSNISFEVEGSITLQEFLFTDDGNGNITIISSDLEVTNDGNGNITIISSQLEFTNDGNGNITIKV